jgi:hypothetical protein
MQTRQGKTAPPDLIHKANRPIRLRASPSNQAVTGVFFCW